MNKTYSVTISKHNVINEHQFIYKACYEYDCVKIGVITVDLHHLEGWIMTG